MAHTQEHYQKSVDAKHLPAPDFKVGDEVFIRAKYFTRLAHPRNSPRRTLDPFPSSLKWEPIPLHSAFLTLCVPFTPSSMSPNFSLLLRTLFQTESNHLQLKWMANWNSRSPKSWTPRLTTAVSNASYIILDMLGRLWRYWWGDFLALSNPARKCNWTYIRKNPMAIGCYEVTIHHYIAYIATIERCFFIKLLIAANS